MKEKVSNSLDDFIQPCNDTCQFCFLNYADVLSETYIFRSIKPNVIGNIIKKVHHQVKKYSQGEFLVDENQKINNLMIIVKGKVVAEMVDFEGKVLRVEQLKAPDSIGSDYLFGDNRAFPFNMVALEETKVLSFPKEVIFQLFKENDQILNNYLNIVANRAQHMSKQIRLHGFHSIKGKLANYLLDMQKLFGNEEFVISNTQTELAQMFGVARPSLSRALREISEEGLITSKGKKIKIIDKEGLSDLLK